MRIELNKLLFRLEKLNKLHENLNGVLLEIETKYPDLSGLVDNYRSDPYKSLKTFIKEVRACDRIGIIKFIPRMQDRVNAAIKLFRAKFNGISFKPSHGKYIVYSSEYGISDARIKDMKEIAKSLCVTLTDNAFKEEYFSRINKASPNKIESFIDNLLFNRMTAKEKLSRLEKEIEETKNYLTVNGEKIEALRKAHNIMTELE